MTLSPQQGARGLRVAVYPFQLGRTTQSQDWVQEQAVLLRQLARFCAQRLQSVPGLNVWCEIPLRRTPGRPAAYQNLPSPDAPAEYIALAKQDRRSPDVVVCGGMRLAGGLDGEIWAVRTATGDLILKQPVKADGQQAVETLLNLLCELARTLRVPGIQEAREAMGRGVSRNFHAFGQYLKAADTMEGQLLSVEPIDAPLVVRLMVEAMKIDPAFREARDQAIAFAQRVAATTRGSGPSIGVAVDELIAAADMDEASLMECVDCFLRVGESSRARAVLERLVAAVPAGSEPYYRLGRILEGEGLPDLAVPHYRDALAREPRYDAWVALGACLANAGKIPEGIECWKQALALNPRGTEALYDLGMAFKAMGRRSEARMHLEKTAASDRAGDLGAKALDLLREEW